MINLAVEDLLKVPPEAIESSTKALTEALILANKEGYRRGYLDGHSAGFESAKSLKKYMGFSYYMKEWMKSFKERR